MVGPRNSAHSNTQQANPDIDIPNSKLNDIITPLCVASGYVQLLQRRIRRREALDHDQLLESLAHVERALQSINHQLVALVDQKHCDTPDRE